MLLIFLRCFVALNELIIINNSTSVNRTAYLYPHGEEDCPRVIETGFKCSFPHYLVCNRGCLDRTALQPVLNSTIVNRTQIFRRWTGRFVYFYK